MPKKQRVPELLWRVFGHRARPLLPTILSLLPPPLPSSPPAEEVCRWCDGRRCLNCCCADGEAAAAAFLLRPGDPPDYRKLLTKCFAAAHGNAPPYSEGFHVLKFRTQRHIVAIAITNLRREKTPPENVLCNGYDKLKRRSATLELLATPAWCLLLERVGGPFMVYLLTNASIFLPTSSMNYLQVAGAPITSLVRRGLKRTLDYRSGAQKKRRFGIEPCDQGKTLCNTNFTSRKIPVLCSCCFQLQATRKLYKGRQIERKYIFHNLESSPSGFPKKHVLNSLIPDFDGSVTLLREIFDLNTKYSLIHSVKCSHRDGFCGIRSSCLYHSIAKLLKRLIRRSRSCQYMRLLEKHCPLPLSDHDTSAKVPNRSQANELKSHCLNSQVVSFVWAVCRSIVPPKLLGTPSNWRVLRRNISKFIELRRYEKYSLKQCMHKLKASKFTFLAAPCSSCHYKGPMLQNESVRNVEAHDGCSKRREMISNLRQKMLERWCFWFFSCLVVPLLQANFYVTQSEHGKQEVFYYRKPIWKQLTDGAMGSLTGQVFKDLDEAAVRNILSKRSYGFSKIRFRPKGTGLRMLVNFKYPSVPLVQEPSVYGESKMERRMGPKLYKSRRSRSMNFILQDIYAVLKSLKLKVPEKLGSSVADYNDVYRKLCPFVLGLKKGGSAMTGVYIVVSDVVKAFDSVDQDKLLSIVEDLMTESQYHVAQSYETYCTSKSIWVRQKSFLADTCAEASTPHGIIINHMESKIVEREEVLLNLKEHIKLNILLFDNKCYLQKIGIPQGSTLSPLLCSFYLGYLEENVILPFLAKSPESVANDPSTSRSCYGTLDALRSEDGIARSHQFLLLRFTDDSLFISTSRDQAARLFSRLKRGFREFNCQMNEKKFSVNFDDGCTLRTQSRRVSAGRDGIRFVKWGGLLVNASTLEIQADYSRYLNNHLRSTLTVCWHGKPASHLKAKLRSFLRPKSHALFFDSNINSAAIVRLNIYQVFVLCAMKFHCYVRDMSRICKFTPSFYWKIIRSSFRYKKKLIKRRMHTPYLPDISPVLKLEKGEVEWLGLVAYVRVLKRKQAMHKQLLASIRSQLLKHRISGSISPELSYAVDNRHSSVLWKVKY